MIELIVKIGLNKDIDKGRNIIQNHLSNKKIKVQEEIQENICFFDIMLVKNKTLSKKEYYSNITNIIMDIIFNIYSTDIIHRKIYKESSNIKSQEKDEIARISKEILLDKDNFPLEKEQIHNQIKDYIMENPIIYIEGFIQFRIKEFDLFMDLVIERGIDEFTLEKEYKEFIKILQYFVDVQEPKYNLINLIFENNDYKLLDEEDNTIDKDFFSEIVNEIDSDGISKEDLLISTLIVLAPKKIILHLDELYKNEDLVKVISNVFQDRTYFCFGCNKCSRNTKIKKGK